jgi:hypothetical protein
MITGIAREAAVGSIPTIPNLRYDNVTTMLFNGSSNISTSSPNWTGAITTGIGLYPEYTGPMAYLLIFLIPFGMMWMAHGNMKLIGILGIITSVFVFFYLPTNFAAAAVLCMVVSAAGFIWGLFKQ